MKKLKRYSLWFQKKYFGTYWAESPAKIEFVSKNPQLCAFHGKIEIHYAPATQMIISRTGRLSRRRYNPALKYNRSTLVSERHFLFDKKETLRRQVIGELDTSSIILRAI